MKKRKRARYGSGCIYKRGRFWWVKWREPQIQSDGRLKNVVKYASTESEDRNHALMVLNEKLSLAGVRRPTDADPAKFTYESMRDAFLIHCVEKKLRSVRWRDGKPTLATIPRLNNYFQGWKAAEITQDAIDKFRADGKRDGLSDARLNRYVATLRAMFRWAARKGKLTAREMPAYFPMVAESRFAPDDTIAIEPRWYVPLREALDEPLRSAFTLAYHTGVRVEEMKRLRWHDIDYGKRRVRLPGTITKTGKTRDIFLPKDFDLPQGAPDALVFPIGDRREDWKKACIKVGAASIINGRYIGPLLRNTRHTAVRNLSDSGLEERRIMDITGHTTRATFDRYNIGDKDDVDVAARAVERLHRKRLRQLDV